MLYQCIPLGKPHTQLWAYMPLGHLHPREPNWVLHGYLLHFVASKFSRTKVCDIYTLTERAFNFSNMAFFETKSKTGTKTFWKHFIHDSVVLENYWNKNEIGKIVSNIYASNCSLFYSNKIMCCSFYVNNNTVADYCIQPKTFYSSTVCSNNVSTTFSLKRSQIKKLMPTQST